jgi:hypothetical protein
VTGPWQSELTLHRLLHTRWSGNCASL